MVVLMGGPVHLLNECAVGGGRTPACMQFTRPAHTHLAVLFQHIQPHSSQAMQMANIDPHTPFVHPSTPPTLRSSFSTSAASFFLQTQLETHRALPKPQSATNLAVLLQHIRHHSSQAMQTANIDQQKTVYIRPPHPPCGPLSAHPASFRAAPPPAAAPPRSWGSLPCAPEVA